MGLSWKQMVPGPSCTFVKGKTQLGSNQELMPKGKADPLDPEDTRKWHQGEGWHFLGWEFRGISAMNPHEGDPTTHSVLSSIFTKSSHTKNILKICTLGLTLYQNQIRKINFRGRPWRAVQGWTSQAGEQQVFCGSVVTGNGGRGTGFRGQSNLNLQTLFEDWKCTLEYKDSG